MLPDTRSGSNCCDPTIRADIVSADVCSVGLKVCVFCLFVNVCCFLSLDYFSNYISSFEPFLVTATLSLCCRSAKMSSTLVILIEFFSATLNDSVFVWFRSLITTRRKLVAADRRRCTISVTRRYIAHRIHTKQATCCSASSRSPHNIQQNDYSCTVPIVP